MFMHVLCVVIERKGRDCLHVLWIGCEIAFSLWRSTKKFGGNARVAVADQLDKSCWLVESQE